MFKWQGPALSVIIPATRPTGSASARNQGARGACGAILVFVDADVEIRSDVLARIRRRFGWQGTARSTRLVS